MIKGIIPMTYCFFNRNNTIDYKDIINENNGGNRQMKWNGGKKNK